MQRAIGGLLIAVCICAMGPTHSLADDSGDGDNKAQAQQHYGAGLRAYNLGDFDRAISEWKTAYQFLGAADFLFNIAQAYRQKRTYDEAVFFYNAYLRGKPDAPNVAEVTALRDEMIALRAKQLENEQMAPEPKQLLGPDGEPTEIPPAKDEASNVSQADTSSNRATETAPISDPMLDDTAPASDGRGLRTIGIAVGGTGIAFVATGIAFALSASSTEDQLEQAAAGREAWSESYADLESRADRNATVGTILIVTGTAAIVAGGVSYFLGHQKDEAAGRVAGLQVAPTFFAGNGDAQAGIAVGLDF